MDYFDYYVIVVIISVQMKLQLSWIGCMATVNIMEITKKRKTNKIGKTELNALSL